MKRAFITGLTGQDGALLARLLLNKGYSVYGMVRRTSSPTNWRLHELGLLGNPLLHVVSGDLTDAASLARCIDVARPSEVYNLGAQSFVGASWDNPLSTMDITGIGAIRLFEAVREYQQGTDEVVRIYQASSSEMFGGVNKKHLMDESEPFCPRSPYGVAKCTAHHSADVYRASYGMHISCGILFNHESEYRGIEFVSRKITDGVVKISLGRQDKLLLGNLDVRRDWGYAGDYVEAMWLMLQQDSPNDYVIATGVSRTIAEFLETAFAKVGIANWRPLVDLDPRFVRPADVGCLRGHSGKAEKILGWERTTTFEQMVEKMVQADYRRLIQ